MVRHPVKTRENQTQFITHAIFHSHLYAPAEFGPLLAHMEHGRVHAGQGIVVVADECGVRVQGFDSQARPVGGQA